MGALESLRQHFGARPESHAPVDDRFIQIDRDEARKRLKLDEQAAKYGAMDEPRTDALGLDPVEQEIISAIGEYQETARKDAHNNIRGYDERLASLGLLDKLANIRGAAPTALADFKAETVITRQRLTLARDAIRDSYKELKAFQREHKLARPAHKSLPAIATNGAIFVAWFVESLANAVLLRVNDDLGLLGGFIAALVIAALNVLVSAAVGRLVWPWAAYKDQSRRLLAWAGITIWVIALVGWNLLSAHYRDAKAGGAASPESAALANFIDQPFSLDTFYSVGLLILGLLTGFGAAYTAYRAEDPYPGYGALYRRHEQRCQEYADEVESARDALEQVRDKAVKEANDTRGELARQFRQRGTMLSGRANFVKRFEEHEGYLEQTANTLLAIYRTANRQARSTPTPAHFEQHWQIRRTELPPETSSFLSEIEIQAVDHELEQTSKALNDAYVDAVESFEPLDELKRRLTDGEI
jgi:hypothetical protein